MWSFLIIAGQLLVLTEAQPSWFSECEGFGCGVTSMYNHRTCTVSSLTDSALKNCLDRQNVHVRFSVSGTLDLKSVYEAPRGTIIDGSGQDVTFTGWDLKLTRDSIVYRIAFKNGKNDAIRLQGDWTPKYGNIWIHQCTFKNYPDGLVDITRGMGKVTVSWSYFYEHDKCNLIAQSVEDDETDEITFHHNYFKYVTQRMPRVRNAYVHVYNNVYNEIGSYAIASSQRAKVLVENNIFMSSSIKNYDCTRIQTGDDPNKGNLRESGNNFNKDCLVETRNPGNVADAPYRYNLEKADSSLSSKVRNGAGYDN